MLFDFRVGDEEEVEEFGCWATFNELLTEGSRCGAEELFSAWESVPPDGHGRHDWHFVW